MQYNRVGENMYKILIIEDDELISKKLESFLKSWNYDVYRITDFYNVMDAFQSRLSINGYNTALFEWIFMDGKDS